LVSANAYTFSSGLPILNCQGKVIGMQTTDLSTVTPLAIEQQEGSGLVSGPSEFFIRRVAKCILRYRKNKCCQAKSCQIEIVDDPVGCYLRFNKGYAGIAYDVFTGSNYDYTVDYTSGVAPLGRPRIRLSDTGSFLITPLIKQLIGIRVLGLAGLNPNDASGVANGYYYVPGGTGTSPLPDFLPISPFAAKLLPGDVITHIDGCEVGDVDKQIAPSLVTWRTCPGDIVKVCYRRGGNALNTDNNSETENYEVVYDFMVALASYPLFMDYPWYAVNHFPLLSTTPYPGFVFPVTQLENPQVPMLNTVGAGVFHPAF